MAKLASSSAESGHTSMDMEISEPQLHQQYGHDREQEWQGNHEQQDHGGGEEDKIWEVFCNSFRQVQVVLDQNRVLITQVNENHQSKIPDNLTKNVALIREINGNISKVVSLYSDLSNNFYKTFQKRTKNSSALNDT